MYEIESFETRAIIREIMPKFYDYIVAAELSEKPYTKPTAMTTTNWSFYFMQETLVHTITASRGEINILRYRIESEFKVFCNAASATTSIKNKDFLTCYKERQIQPPMLYHIATIIVQYLPPKLKRIGTSPLQGYIYLLVLQGCH